MENLENIPMGKIMKFLSQFQCRENKNIYKLPLNVCMDKSNDITETDILWSYRLIKAHLTCNSLEYHVFYQYRSKEFWVFKDGFYMEKMLYSFDIDYFNRSKYIPLIKSINDCISENGVFILTANNLPNSCSLTCHFYDCQENSEKVQLILSSNKIKIFQQTSIGNLTQDYFVKLHNQTNLMYGSTEEQIFNILSYICIFPENERLVTSQQDN